MREISRKGIRTKLDKLVKDYVKNRDNFTCQYCGKQLIKEDCHASHVIPVSAGLWWAYDPINLKVLCFHHHINFWHKNPVDAGNWFRSKFPERWSHLEKMRSIYNNHKTITDKELVEHYEGLKLLLDKQAVVL